MMNYLRAFCFTAACFSVFGGAQAQEPEAAKLYERGVNAYFDGCATEADGLLSEAIQWNSQDPRAYYFRAFSLLREGRLAEAQGDMLTGATLEAQSPQGQAIGAALERVQGCDRLMLEHFRCRARREAAIQTSEQTLGATETPAAGVPPQALPSQPLPQPPQARPQLPTPPQALPPSRPQTFKPQDEAVLRERRIVPLEELLRPGGPQTVAEEPEQPEAQAKTNTPPSAPPAVVTPPGTPAGNPFEDDSQKSAPEPEKPAAAAPKIPPQSAPAATPATPPAANPPAAPATKAEDNPFG